MVKKKVLSKGSAATLTSKPTTPTPTTPASKRGGEATTQSQKQDPPTSSRQLRQRMVQEVTEAPVAVTPTPPAAGETKKLTTAVSAAAATNKRPKLKAVSTNVPVSKNKGQEEAEESQQTKSVESREAEELENIGLFEFYNKIKRHCILSDKWVLFEPRMDPQLLQNVILALEMDVTIEGDLRVKRSVKILEDRSYNVLIDNVDLTHLFLEKKLSAKTTQDVYRLIYSVQRKKVCAGVKIFEPIDNLFPKLDPPVHKRNNMWYANGCTIVVHKSQMGNSCALCQRIRNQLKRKEQLDGRRNRKPAHKLVKSSFGKALYSTLNDFSGKGVIPASQYAREDMVYDDKMDVHLSRDLHTRLEVAASMPPPPPPPPKKSKSRGKDRSRTSRGKQQMQQQVLLQQQQMGYSQAIPVQEFITEDGQICYITDGLDHSNGQIVTQLSGNGEPFQWGGQMVVEKFEPPEIEASPAHSGQQILQLSDGNIIIQNINGDFHLAPGQEYEIIGESATSSSSSSSAAANAAAASMDQVEIVPADPDQITILGLVEDEDDVHYHGAMDNMQIAAVDPNDPNFSQLIKAFQQQM